jgi:hypothetical protein
MMRRLLRLSAAVLAGLLILTGVGQPAQAGSGYPACGVTCDGKDPANYALSYLAPYYYCSKDATTVRSVQYDNWRAELRYSNRCETTWARLIDLGTGSLLPMDLYHISKNGNGTVRKSTRNDFVSGGGNWTTMLDDHNLSNSICLNVYADEWHYADGVPEFSGCSAGY